MAPARRIAPTALRGEDGLTIVEVMVAGLILVIGSLGLLSLVDTTARSTFRAEQGQVVSDRLQQEIEVIKQLPYEEVALTGLPSDTSNTKLPNWRVVGSGYATAENGTGLQPMVTEGGALYAGGTVTGGAVSPAPEPFESGDVTGTIHRFVTWEDDPTCGSACPGSQDMKRVIVSVVLDRTASGGTRAYQELQAQISDPASEAVDNENPIVPGDEDGDGIPDDEEGVPWTLWLTDTTCDNSERQPITGSHPTHNTRGACGAGERSGNDPGAPDLLIPGAPEFDEESPIFDYATDVEPEQSPAGDRGVQLVRGDLSGCDPAALTVATAPENDNPDRFQEVHKWLSPPMPEGTELELASEGSLNLWTRTINGAVHDGRICIWLFARDESGTAAVDGAAVNLLPPTANQPWLTYEQRWPSEWGEVHIPLRFQLGALAAGDRVGLAIAVEGGGTPGGGLQFMYDEPSFDSRLELKTNSQVPTL